MELIIIAIIALGIAVFVGYTIFAKDNKNETHPLDSATNKYTGEPVSTYVEPPPPVAEEPIVIAKEEEVKVESPTPVEAVKTTTAQEKPRKKYYKPKANANANKQSSKKPVPNTGQPKKPAIKK